MNQQEQVEQFLEQHNIAYTLYQHPAVFTCQDAEQHCKHVPGIPGKNLFLKDKNGRYFLYIIPAKKRADLKAFAKEVSATKVTFGNDKELKEKLGLAPGSVSIFGLINDTKKEIVLNIDKEIYDAPIVNFHPNINTASLELSNFMFKKLLTALNHEVYIIS